MTVNRRPARHLLLIYLVGLLTGSNPVQAGGWSDIVLIDTLRQYQAGYLLVTHTGGLWPNPDFCSASNYAVVNPTSRGYNELNAMLVSAHLVRRRVNLYLNGCLQVGTMTFPIVAQAVLQ